MKMNLGRHQESALADTAGGGKGETVLAHLEELKNAPEVKKDQNKKSLKESTTTSSTTTYELLMRPEKARLEEAESLARLDKRLEVLEQALGTSQESMVRKLQQCLWASLCTGRRSRALCRWRRRRKVS